MPFQIFVPNILHIQYIQLMNNTNKKIITRQGKKNKQMTIMLIKVRQVILMRGHTFVSTYLFQYPTYEHKLKTRTFPAGLAGVKMSFHYFCGKTVNDCLMQPFKGPLKGVPPSPLKNKKNHFFFTYLHTSAVRMFVDYCFSRQHFLRETICLFQIKPVMCTENCILFKKKRILEFKSKAVEKTSKNIYVSY